MSLVDNLIKEGWLKTPEIINAFKKIKREDFLPDDLKNLAELNEALPIGFSQTISQPLTVAFMLELLQPKPGDKILDVGAGSGWTTALVSFIVKGSEISPRRGKSLPRQKRSGRVIALEVVPELAEFGRKNVEKYGFIKDGIVKFVCADGAKGFLPALPIGQAGGRQVKKNSPDKEIYDKILVSASAKKLPEELKNQLKIKGRLVCPIENSIWLFIKKNENDFEEKEYPGFVFVPLV